MLGYFHDTIIFQYFCGTRLYWWFRVAPVNRWPATFPVISDCLLCVKLFLWKTPTSVMIWTLPLINSSLSCLLVVHMAIGIVTDWYVHIFVVSRFSSPIAWSSIAISVGFTTVFFKSKKLRSNFLLVIQFNSIGIIAVQDHLKNAYR